MIPDSLLDEAARRFSLLGDPTRLRLLRTLQERGEISVGELAAGTGVARERVPALGSIGRGGHREPASSRHFPVYYRIADETLVEAVRAGLRLSGRTRVNWLDRDQ